MSDQAKAYRQKAEHCERAGSLATTLDARLMYADLAQQWRELAEQIELPDQQTRRCDARARDKKQKDAAARCRRSARQGAHRRGDGGSAACDGDDHDALSHAGFLEEGAE